VTAHSLVDPDRYIGTVTLVTASAVQANMPFGVLPKQIAPMFRSVI
jgi:hypothetical protein